MSEELVPPPIPPDSVAPKSPTVVAPPADPIAGQMAKLEALQAQLAAELQAAAEAKALLTTEATKIQEWQASEAKNARLSYVRSMNMAVPFSDDQLNTLLPQADVRTEAGKAALNAWREGPGKGFFVQTNQAPAVDIGVRIEGITKNDQHDYPFGGKTFLNRILRGA